MSKYQPLNAYLSGRIEAETPMTFSEVETVLGFALPPAARRHRAWWSNNPDNSVVTTAWLGAGFRTAQVDMANQSLKFVRAAETEAAPRGRAPAKPGGRLVVPALRGALAGTVRFVGDEEGDA